MSEVLLQEVLLQQVSAKFAVTADSQIELDDYIPVFHAWIRDKKIPDYLLIDVADYRHVPNGPGVMLIADEGHYGIDASDGSHGLLFSRRRDPAKPAKDALREALKRTVEAALLLEAEELKEGSIRFDTKALRLQVVSRLYAPNNEESWAKLSPLFSELLSELGFEGVELAPEADKRAPFTMQIASCGKAPELKALAAALA